MLLLPALGSTVLIPRPENGPDAAADGADTEPAGDDSIIDTQERYP